MKLNFNEKNIAAVSLVEIMMIFAIIGIVTTACMGLSKPKLEYTTKLKLYSALEALEKAGKIIASEGHIDFTTDVNTCTNRTASGICKDYNKTGYPNKNTLLPKVSQRAASTNQENDPGLTSYTLYSSLTATEKAQFKYLQDGLCQRLGHAFNLPPANINCSKNISVAGDNLIDNIPTQNDNNYFYYKKAQLYLPNGQVYYISKNLYNDYLKSNNVLSTNIVYSNFGTYETSYMSYSSMNLRGVFERLYSNDTGDYLLNTPTETRLAMLKNFKESPDYANASTIYVFLNHLEKAWSQSKDYFIIYVDTNCKMKYSDDVKCGPDKLGTDVFGFKMYRDGTVLPGPGFPDTWITAKVLAKDTTTSPNKYNNNNLLPYAAKSITASKCYANLLGIQSSDRMGICYKPGGSVYYPLNQCIAEDGESNCKSIVNKPSFLMR